MSEIRTSERLRAGPEPALKVGKSERTRAEILGAAFEFLWSRPYREMTVNSLMASTTVSRSAFYQYFRDIHELMESLLVTLEGEILSGAQPWFLGAGDPVALLSESLDELVRVCHLRGPFLKAVADAATTDKCLEDAWNEFLGRFDEAVGARIAADQESGLISTFEPRPLAVALNRLDAYTLIHAFGQHPRGETEPVKQAIKRLWIASLYGPQWLESLTSSLSRKQALDPETLASYAM
jgi:AcrR family transcriptional regulator